MTTRLPLQEFERLVKATESPITQGLRVPTLAIVIRDAPMALDGKTYEPGKYVPDHRYP